MSCFFKRYKGTRIVNAFAISCDYGLCVCVCVISYQSTCKKVPQ